MKRKRRSCNEELQLPFDILREILVRLPVSSIVRFKSVCRLWNSVINDPDFVRYHLRHVESADSNGFNALLIDRDGPLFRFSCMKYIEGNVFKEATPLLKDEHHRLYFSFSSCDGLVLLMRSSGCIIVWNPSTGQVDEIPHPRYFEKSRLYYSIGLGYDHRTNNYKILSVPCNRCKLVELFSFETQSWKLINEGKPWKLSDEGEDWPYEIIDASSTAVNKRPHWLTEQYIAGQLTVTYFDAGEETVGEIMLPDSVAASPAEKVLREFGGCLGLSEYYGDDDYGWDGEFVLWSMKEYGVKESWMKLIKIQTSPKSPCASRPLFITKTRQVVFTTEDKKLLLLYDPKHHSFREEHVFWNTDKKLLKRPYVWDIPYVESLISPFRLGGTHVPGTFLTLSL